MECRHSSCSSYIFLYIRWFNVKALLSHPGLGWLDVCSSFMLPPPPQRLLLLMSKPFQLNLRYLGQRKYRSGKMCWMTSPWPWPKVTAVALIDKNMLLCKMKWQPHQPITTSHAYYLIRFRRNSIRNFFLANLFWLQSSSSVNGPFRPSVWPLVRLSICGQNGVSSISSTILFHIYISYYISYQPTSEGVSHVVFLIPKFKFLAISLNL